jgi:multiple sugar transport system ATP-binding protein
MGVTTVYVTHDQTEAMTLGDRVAVLRRGVLQQVASPRDLYEHPANLFVAGFIGSPPMNLLPAEVSGRTVSLPFAQFETGEAAATRAEGRGLLLAGIRPEHLADASSLNGKADEGVTFEATVDLVEWLGNEQYAYVGFDAPPELAGRLRELAHELDSEALRTQLVASVDPSRVILRGEPNRFWFDPAKVLLFDPTTEENLTSGPV